MDDDFVSYSKKMNRVTLSPGFVFGYRIQRNARDLVPNSGIGVRLYADVDLSAEGGNFERALIGLGDLYLPWLSKYNTGIRLKI